MTADPEEALRLALNLGRNCGYAVFPCGDNKKPTVTGWPERASCDPEAICKLWHEHPGPLIGVVTGARSRVSVLDVDQKHSEGVLWWQDNCHRLLPTLTVRTARAACIYGSGTTRACGILRARSPSASIPVEMVAM